MGMCSLYEGLISTIYPDLSGKDVWRYFPQAVVDSFFLEWLKTEKNRKELGITWFQVEEGIFSQKEADAGTGAQYGWPKNLRVNIVLDGLHVAFLFKYDYSPIGSGIHSGIRFIWAEREIGSNEVAKKIIEKFAGYLKASVSFETLAVRGMRLITGLHK